MRSEWKDRLSKKLQDGTGAKQATAVEEALEAVLAIFLFGSCQRRSA